jgi:DmsE family decaheme c-type cytochrome
VKAQFSMPFKHRVNEGAAQCTDCHNPHGTFAATWGMAGRSHMVDQKEGNEEACLKCHADKRGPFVYEHASVRIDGCQVCHMPHGSTNPRMLTRPTVFTVCLECHNGAGTFGISNNGVIHLSATHNLAQPRYQNCTTCHVRIHGSNADALFMR